ncbi:MAG TPA: DUF4249 domain-containing protein [Cyclobacteriaceae bacterium]|nr:DUF4249 domain-containing protein [Cyclobacteriaceae bacterium]
MGSGFKNSSLTDRTDKKSDFAFIRVIRAIRESLVFLVFSVLVSACLPDPLEINTIPQLESKIVVSSQMIPDFAVAVLLTKSVGALDASDNSDPQALINQILIADASVSIQSKNTTHRLQYVGNGVYGVIGANLIAGESYTLYVNSPSMGSIQATTTVKPLVQFQDVKASLYITGRDTLAQVDYTLKDPAGKNWYMMNAQHVSQKNLEERILNPWISTKLVDDAEFEGGTKRDYFRLLFDEVEEGDTLAVLLSNIDKDYYDFMKIREDTRFGLASYLGEPINYPTNIEGGLGFFNLYVPDVRVFILNSED